MSDSFWIGLDWMHKYIISFVLFSEHFLAGWGFHIASHTPPSPSPIHLSAWSVFGGNGLYMTRRSVRNVHIYLLCAGSFMVSGRKGKGRNEERGRECILLGFGYTTTTLVLSNQPHSFRDMNEMKNGNGNRKGQSPFLYHYNV